MLGIFGRHDELYVWPIAFNPSANLMPERRADSTIWLCRRLMHLADGAESA